MTRGALRLAAELKARGLSQTSLAEQLDVDGSMVSRLVRGARKPSLAIAARLEELLAIPMPLWAVDVVTPRRTRRAA